MKKILTIAIIGIAGIISSACGGGGGNNNVAPTISQIPHPDDIFYPASEATCSVPESAVNVRVPVPLGGECITRVDYFIDGTRPTTVENRRAFLADFGGISCTGGIRGNPIATRGTEPVIGWDVYCTDGDGKDHLRRIEKGTPENLPVGIRHSNGTPFLLACVTNECNRVPIFLAKPEARPEYNDALVEGYMPKQYFQIGVDSNDTPFGFSADLQDDGFRQLGFVYGDVRVDYMSLPSQIGTVIDSYRIGYTFDDALYVGIDNYNNGILSGKYNRHTFGAVSDGSEYAVRYEYKITLGE